VADRSSDGADQFAGPEGGQKAGPGGQPGSSADSWRLVSEANRFSLAALRTNWGRTYAINFDGTDWTASPRDSPDTVLTHQNPEHLSTLISLDYTRRALQRGMARHDDAWYREGFSSST
jgi:hypothetical protein